MTIAELEKFILDNKYTTIKNTFHSHKIENSRIFFSLIEQVKVIFIKTDNIILLDRIAMLFKEFKINSGVPLIIGKLLSMQYLDNGGTLLYSLQGLKRKHFEKEYLSLLEEEISFEMRNMIAFL